MITYSVKLTRYSATQDTIPDVLRQAWPITIEAAGVNMPSEIFVYHAGLVDDTGINGDRFECIASLPQLLNLPVGEPVENVPYYRLTKLQRICRSASEADDLWTNIKSDVDLLVQNFIASKNLEAVETATFSEAGEETDTTQNAIVQWLITSVDGNDYELTAPVYDSNNILDHSPVLWPDGSAGNYQTTAKNIPFRAVDAYEITHIKSGKKVVQALVTRNITGLITSKPALTVLDV